MQGAGLRRRGGKKAGTSMGLAGIEPGWLLGEVDGGEAAEQRRKGMRNRRETERQRK